jgi:hypothetical protein
VKPQAWVGCRSCRKVCVCPFCSLEIPLPGRSTNRITGIIAQLTQATNGIGVILEHRYYGTSFPTPDISTENLRFLTTEQALADQAYFSKHIKFPGLVSRSQRCDSFIVDGAFVLLLIMQNANITPGGPRPDKQNHRPHRLRWLLCRCLRLFPSRSLPGCLLGSYLQLRRDQGHLRLLAILCSHCQIRSQEVYRRSEDLHSHGRQHPHWKERPRSYLGSEERLRLGQPYIRRRLRQPACLWCW